MTKHSKKKKAVLGTAISLLAPAITELVSGSTVEGYILIGTAAGLIILYDYLDDKAKGEPTLPPGMDTETFVTLAETGAGMIHDIQEARTNSNESDTES